MTCKQEILNILSEERNYIPKGLLCQIMYSRGNSYIGETVGRKAREMETEGLIEVTYINGHSNYRIKRREPQQMELV